MITPNPTPLSPERETPICTQEAARAAGLDVAPTPTELALCAQSIVRTWGDRSAEPDDEVGSTADTGAQLARAVPLLLAKLAELEHGPLTVYRARHVVGDRASTLGHYRTREQAQARCIAELRAEMTLVPDVIFNWVGVDGAEVLNISTPADPFPDVRDYVVTAVTVSSTADEGAVR
ncbi:hypothetical protein ACFV2X_38190 [Streptomyces sp. NPDC059679]|uniref:hypothetical protein n=1 Tax=Streptomyces sp. NPDC059679 TaxID=3346903 RepID=UPI0036A199A9